MKKAQYLLTLILFLCGCHMGTNKDVVAGIQKPLEAPAGYTHPQAWMNDLKKQYTLEFNSAVSAQAKNLIKEKYRQKLHAYLMDSCLKLIKCGNLYVRKIKKEIDTTYVGFSASFTDNNANYIFSGSYATNEDLNDYPEYQLVTTLREGTTINLTLLYTGECYVSDPSDKMDQTFIIKATPYVE